MIFFFFSSRFLVYRNDQPMMGCGVTEGAAVGTCKNKRKWERLCIRISNRLVCLRYTFVLSAIPLALGHNSDLHEFSHISSGSNGVLSAARRQKMKEKPPH